MLHGDCCRDDLPGQLDQDMTLGTWKGPALSRVDIWLERKHEMNLISGYANLNFQY